MTFRCIALLTLLGTSGCATVVKHASIISLDAPAEEEHILETDESCHTVATPAFYGHYGTCWNKWPQGWTPCAHGEVEVTEETPIEAPAAPKTSQLDLRRQTLVSSIPIFKIPITAVARKSLAGPTVTRRASQKPAPTPGIDSPSVARSVSKESVTRGPTHRAPRQQLIKEQLPPKLFVVAPDESQDVDQELAKAISVRLKQSLKPRNTTGVTLHVNVTGDVAWISGTVTTIDLRDELLKVAEQTDGVRRVYHQLRLTETKVSAPISRSRLR